MPWTTSIPTVASPLLLWIFRSFVFPRFIWSGLGTATRSMPQLRFWTITCTAWHRTTITCGRLIATTTALVTVTTVFVTQFTLSGIEYRNLMNLKKTSCKKVQYERGSCFIYLRRKRNAISRISSSRSCCCCIWRSFFSISAILSALSVKVNKKRTNLVSKNGVQWFDCKGHCTKSVIYQSKALTLLVQ